MYVLADLISQALEHEVVSVKRNPGGRNSRIFLVDTANAQRYIAKFYPEARPGSRDRLTTEFAALSFLNKQGEDRVPQPIALDEANRLGVYEFIEGDVIAPATETTSDLDQTVDFVGRLRSLSTVGDAAGLPDASEARFSVQGLLDILHSRIQPLLDLQGDGSSNLALNTFLETELAPSLAAIEVWCRDQSGQVGHDMTAELPLEDRTLSPSDIGLHNVLRRSDGRLFFLDFEYFGWDDPAKMISDFLLHPAMSLTVDLKQRFASRAIEKFGNPVELSQRLRVIYPLVALKWCLILLNEFLPEHYQRRSFANVGEIDAGAVLDQQLAKARRQLNQINCEYQNTKFSDQSR